MDKLLFSTREVFTEYLHNNGMSYFNIPEYQRGYKWNAEDVKTLLNDLKAFEESKPKEGHFYCLQNITIVPDKERSCFNVVDGQQRLTTMYILLSYLRKFHNLEGFAFIPECLRYSVREETAKVLRENISTGAIWETTIDPHNSSYKDEWYIKDVANGIQEWFNDKDNDISNDIITDKLQIIINKMDVGNEESIFAGLNGGKVDLDGADLVRAELITRSSREKYGETSTPAKTNEFRVRIGIEIDEMNRWWADEDHKKYFQQFLRQSTTKNAQFNADLYPIDLLYQLYYECDKDQEEPLNFRFFEHGRDTNNMPNDHDHWELYDSVVEMHKNLQEWYEDNQIYHWLGFLFFNFKNRSEVNFRSIYRKWTKWKKWKEESFIRKAEFLAYIRSVVKKGLLHPYVSEENDGKEIERLLTAITNTEQDWYADQNGIIDKVLIMMDIMICTDMYIYNQKQKEDYSHKKERIPVDYLKRNNEDKEHIRSCTPNDAEGKEIRDKKKWIDHITELYITSSVKDEERQFGEDILAKLKTFWNEELSDSQIQELNQIMNRYSQNSIGNLVLLNQKINRGYRNDPFQKKIQRIIAEYMRQVNYVRPYTLMVFLSIVDSKIADWRWTHANIKSNAENIRKQVESFLSI